MDGWTYGQGTDDDDGTDEGTYGQRTVDDGTDDATDAQDGRTDRTDGRTNGRMDGRMDGTDVIYSSKVSNTTLGPIFEYRSISTT